MLTALAALAQQDSPPRTGEFDLSYTVAQLVGEHSAQTVADVMPADEPITYSMYVPPSYDPDKPAGVMVYTILHTE